jgi:hypothetical protein
MEHVDHGDASEFLEFSYDPATGIREYIRDNGDGTVTLRATQDVSSILNATTREFAQVDERARFGEFARVGSIPMSMWNDPNYGLKGGDPDAIKRFLRDPDLSKFRTRPGKIR